MRQRHQTAARIGGKLVQRLRVEVRRLSLELRRFRSENARLRRIASTDALTGIANRAAFRAKLSDAVRGALESPCELSLLILDVDEFNTVNDRFGHPAGDRALRKVAHLLRATIRESDFLARYAGDEFVVLLPATDCDGARIIAERLRAAVAEASWPNAPVTVSIGVGSLDSTSPNARRLIRDADRALYRAKEAGRNRVGEATGSKSDSAPPTSLAHKYRPGVKFRVPYPILRPTLPATELAENALQRTGT